MEDQKTPLKFKFKIRRNVNGGLEIEKSQSQENTEKKTMGFLLKLQNQVPSSSMEEKSKIENYSNGNSRCSTQYLCSSSNSCEILYSRLPNWSKRAKRGRKRSISSSTSSFSSIEKQKEPSLCEKEVADALLMLVSGFSLDFAKQKGRIITEFPDIKKKRKIEDTNMVHYAEHQKETRVYGDGFMLDTEKKIPVLSSTSSGNFICGVCGKSFSCYQALGGHKSKCKINYCSHGELAQFAGQGSMRNKNNQINGSLLRLHECKLCSMKFSTGQALGGHQRSHRIEPLIISKSSVSPSKEIRKEPSIYPINSVTVAAVDGAKNDLSGKKITLEEGDELAELRLSPRSIFDF